MLAITGGRVLDGCGNVLENGTVLIENGKIRAVGAGLAVPEGAQVIDAAGGWVTPGLIDAHTHLAVLGEPKTRGESGDANESVAPATPHMRAIDAFDPSSPGLFHARRGGFTAACVLPGSANVIGGTGFAFKLAPRATVDEMMIPGTEVMKFALGENPRANYRKDNKIKTRMGVAASLRETLFAAREYSEALKSVGPGFKRDFRLEPLVSVVRGEMLCRFHCHRSDDIATVLRVAEEFSLKYSLEHATESFKMTGQIARAGVTCVIGPLVSGPYKQEVWERSLRTPGILEKAGIPLCLTEDSGILTKLLPMHVGLCIKNGLSYDGALRAVTIEAARLLGIADRTGSLEVGKDADVAVFNGDPFSNYTTCLHTVIDGEVFTHDPAFPDMA